MLSLHFQGYSEVLLLDSGSKKSVTLVLCVPQESILLSSSNMA